MTTETESVSPNHVIIDGQYYELLDGSVSNASKAEDGDQTNAERSWSMELMFSIPSWHLALEPAAMKVLEISATLRGVTYTGNAVVTLIQSRGITTVNHDKVSGDQGCVVAFVGKGPLVSKQIDSRD